MQNALLGLADNGGKWLLCFLYLEQIPIHDGAGPGDTVRRRFLQFRNRDRRPQSRGRRTSALGAASEAGRRQEKDAETEAEKTEGAGRHSRGASGFLVPGTDRRGTAARGCASAGSQPLTAALQHT